METSFFTRAGRLCRYLLLALIIYASINATENKDYFRLSLSQKEEGSRSGLSEFRGESGRNRKIDLKWRVNGSSPLSFTVEKSRDGEHFTPVESKGIQEAEPKTFRWTDPYPKATNCYRLRMVDSTGSVSYSKTLVIETFKSGDVVMVGATPQVAQNDIKVDVQLKETAMVNLHITNEKGDIVMEENQKGKSGLNHYVLAGSNKLAPGNYFLKVVVNGTDRMLVQLIKA